MGGALGAVLQVVVLAIVVVGVSLAQDFPIWYVQYGIALLAWAAFGAFRGYLRWRYIRWRVDATGLHVRSGRFWRTEATVPRARIQHLEVQRDPIERRYGLATLTVYTAGTHASATSVSGLRDDDAVRVRDDLMPAPHERDDLL